MSRFAWWRSRRHAVSRSTAPAGHSRPVSPIPAIAAVLPDSDSRLSDGIVVEARLRARVLGAPLLRVDGVVLVSPGRLVEPPDALAVTRTAGAGGPSVNGAPGVSLAQAARLLADNEADIERWHQDVGSAW